MDGEKKLRGLISELIDEKTKEQTDEIVDKNAEKVAKLKEENSEMKTRLEALENAPAMKVKLPVPGEDTTVDAIYKGRNLADMSLKLSLPDDRKQALSKFFIDFVEKALNNGHAKVALNETTTTQGGYMVFDQYIRELLAFARLQSVCLQECRVIDVSSDSIRIPYEDTSVSVAWYSEAGTISNSEPTVGELNLTPTKLAAYAMSSNELLADSAFDVVSWLTELFAEAIGQEIDNQVWNGTTFTALVSASGINTVETTGNAVSGVDIDYLAQVVSSLAPNKLMGAKFYMHRNNFRYIRALEDGAGNAVYTPAMGGAPGRIWEYPYVLSEQMPSTATSNDVIGIFGNLNHYIIARRKGDMTLDVDPYGRFLNDQTRFRTTTRWHGAPWNAGGFTQMKI
jgi:HK97 family phage major capsid protein